MTDVVVRTKLHETWKEASAEERYLFMHDICKRYKELILAFFGKDVCTEE